MTDPAMRDMPFEQRQPPRRWWNGRRALAPTGMPPDIARFPALLTLPSTDAALTFSVRAEIYATRSGNDFDLRRLKDIAEEHITRNAEEISHKRLLTEGERLRRELNVTLGRWMRAFDTTVQARCDCESVEVDQELVAAVAERQRVTALRSALSWQDQRKLQETSEMCSLLRDPLRATARWYLHNQDQPGQLVATAEAFQQIRNILGAEERTDSVGLIVDEFLQTAEEAPAARAQIVLAKMFTNFGRSDLAGRLQVGEHFNGQPAPMSTETDQE